MLFVIISVGKGRQAYSDFEQHSPRNEGVSCLWSVPCRSNGGKKRAPSSVNGTVEDFTDSGLRGFVPENFHTLSMVG